MFVGKPEGHGPAEEDEADTPLVGMVVVLVDLADPVPATHLVSVYVRPEHRGTGLAQQLFQNAIQWSWDLENPRMDYVRLWVHEENARAEALYGSFGFVRSGKTRPDPKTDAKLEYEMVLPRR